MNGGNGKGADGKGGDENGVDGKGGHEKGGDWRGLMGRVEIGGGMDVEFLFLINGDNVRSHRHYRHVQTGDYNPSKFTHFIILYTYMYVYIYTSIAD